MAKIKVIQEKKKQFQPIKVEITIESKKEYDGFRLLHTNIRSDGEALIAPYTSCTNSMYYADDIIASLAAEIADIER